MFGLDQENPSIKLDNHHRHINRSNNRNFQTYFLISNYLSLPVEIQIEKIKRRDDLVSFIMQESY